jgi:hypothetical protein
MNITEFLAHVEAGREARRNAPPPLPCPIPDTASSDEMIACGCGDCMERAMGRELDDHPITALRPTRRFRIA